MKLGHIDYLNSYPFYYQMLEKAGLKGVRILSGLPGALNRMMTEGKLDLSPISSVKGVLYILIFRGALQPIRHSAVSHKSCP